MQSLNELLQDKIELYKQDNWADVFKVEKKEYEQTFKKAVTAFMDRINKDREKEQMEKVSFIAIRSKIAHLDIEVLRWFYGNCLKYAKKKGNTFSRCFFGSLKAK